MLEFRSPLCHSSTGRGVLSKSLIYLFDCLCRFLDLSLTFVSASYVLHFNLWRSRVCQLCKKSDCRTHRYKQPENKRLAWIRAGRRSREWEPEQPCVGVVKIPMWNSLNLVARKISVCRGEHLRVEYVSLNSRSPKSLKSSVSLSLSHYRSFDPLSKEIKEMYFFLYKEVLCLFVILIYHRIIQQYTKKLRQKPESVFFS